MNSPFEIPCVILCGGKSSRMGEDKALLPFDSFETLSEFQYQRLQPLFYKIFLSSKMNKFNFNCEIIFDNNELHSPLIALRTILESISTQKVFILTVDTPFVTFDTIKKLIFKSKDYDITVAKTSRLHNLCGVFDKNCLTVINQMISEDIHKIGFLLKKVNTNIVNFDNDDEFLNLNEKDDYNKALSIIS